MVVSYADLNIFAMNIDHGLGNVLDNNLNVLHWPRHNFRHPRLTRLIRVLEQLAKLANLINILKLLGCQIIDVEFRVYAHLKTFKLSRDYDIR